MSSLLARVVLLALPFLGSTSAFSFALQTGANGQISKCGRVNVIWQGGTPPFHMVVVPAFDYPSNVSIPESAWSAATQFGNYSWTVNYPAGTRLVAMMSDSSGEGAGGVSQLYTVADSSANCQMRSSTTDFLFYLNSTSVNQCAPLRVTWDSTAVSPVRLLGVIPSGQPFMFHANPGSTSWTWNTNVAAGTSFILGAFNGGKTGIGGSSDLMTVGQGSAGCLDDSSPSSTPAATVPTQTTSGRTGAGTGVSNGTNVSGGGGVKTVTAIATVMPEGKAGLGTGAIVGIVISAVLALLALQGALVWFCCRRQISDLLSHRKDMRTKGIKSGEVDLASQYDGPQSPMDTFQGDARTGTFGRTTYRQSAYGENSDVYESTISPFHDDRRTSRPDLLGDRALSAYTAYDTDSILAPPPRPYGRTDSVGSGLTLDLPMSTFDSFDMSSPTESPLLPPPSTTRFNSDQSSTSYPAVPAAASQRQPQTKAQIAASLSLHNADMDRVSRSDPYGGMMPSQTAPVGGLRRHEDAGRARADVEDLPPLYRPEWEAESRRRGSGGA